MAQRHGMTQQERQERKREEDRLVHHYVQHGKAAVLAGLLGLERIERLDHWIKKQEDPSLDRDEALRRLVDIGLAPHVAL